MNEKIDWSQYEVKESAQPKVDWSQYEVKDNAKASSSDEDEGFPIPEITGISGIGSDLLSAALGAKKFAEDIPENLEKSGRYAEEHPATSLFHNLGQVAAESADIGKGLINAPYALNQYLARKHLLPQVLGKLGKLIPHIPEDTGVEKALGLEADPEKGDSLIRAIPDIASLVVGGKPLAKQVKNIAKGPDLKQVIRDTQAKVNTVDKSLGKAFDTVEQEVDKRGIGKIPVSKETINNAERFLEKTPESKDLIKRARAGDYKALRDLQADLRQIGETALSNKLTTERKIGKEAISARKDINKSIEKHFDESGHKDLAALLKDARTGYGDLQKTYFSTPALAKVFGKSQKVPKNPLTLLTEESTEMNKFMSSHPEVKKAMEKALSHKDKMKTAKGLGKIALTAIGVEEAGRLLHK